MPVLSFKGKTAVETYHHTVPHHTLEFDRKLSCLPKGEDPSLDGNLIIEGDNLIALKALLPTHAGRIHCVYIDPPYNRGTEDWVYNDNLTQPQFKEWIGRTVGKEGEDACRHDKWCCMMYPRLMLLKELLHENGVMCISIDESELKHLLHLTAEIFGPESAQGVIIVESNPRGRRLGTEIAVEHEYIVVCTKRAGFSAGRLDLTEEQLREYGGVDKTGRSYRLLGLRKRGALSRRVDRPNLHFPIYVDPRTAAVAIESCGGWVKVLPQLSDGTDGVWRWQPSTVVKHSDRLLAKMVRRRDSGRQEWDIFEIDYAESEGGNSKGRLFGSIWQGSEFNNETGRDQIKAIFGETVFQYPKPVGLVKQVLRLCGHPDGWVLDSFSGSGTTAQAVFELNAEDAESQRRVILVQQPYDNKKDEEAKVNICRTITAKRARCVITGYAYEGTQKETLLEERLTLTKIKRADELMAQVEKVKAENAKRFDEVKAECKDGVVRVVGIKKIKGKADGLGGSFTYARVSEHPLLGEYRDLGERLPSYDDIAKYVFYTETSRQWDKGGADKETGKIGEHAGTSYYLLYRPNRKTDWPIDMEFLNTTAKHDPNRNLVVYCEKIWLHRADLREWEQANRKKVRPMLVPFNLK